MFWLLSAFAISAGSITLTRSAMFIPVRRWIARDMGELAGALFRCHYCMSHWLSAAVIAVYQPMLISTMLISTSEKSVGALFWADLVVAWLALVGMSAIISGLIMFFTPFTSED